MFEELIKKIKMYKKQANKINKVEAINNPLTKEENKVNITVTKIDNISKIEISDYISINDFVDKENSSDKYSILNKLCNCVLWNSNERKVNKGIYYVIIVNDCIYNILFTDDRIMIDERTKIDIDEETNYQNITQERVITYNINENTYHYYSAKHEENGNTYYTKYYNTNRTYSLGELDLTKKQAYEEMGSVISNLETINGIENILDLEFLKEHTIKDLNKGSIKIKKI